MWVEYLSGTDTGGHLTPVIESGEHATSILTVAELADKLIRDGYEDPDSYLAYVPRASRLLGITEAIAGAAGATKHRQRAAGVPTGLVDAMIYETAQAHDLTVLTGDPDFEGLDGVEMVG